MSRMALLGIALAAMVGCRGAAQSVPALPGFATASTHRTAEIIYTWRAKFGSAYVTAFSTSGKLLGNARSSDTAGFFKVDPLGNVWLAARNVRIYRHGDLTRSPTILHLNSGAADVVFGADGTAYLTTGNMYGRDAGIRVYDPGKTSTRTFYPYRAYKLALDTRGVLYASVSGAIVELDTTHGGKYLREIAIPATSVFARMLTDRDGALYVATFKNGNNATIFKFDAGATSSAWSAKVVLFSDWTILDGKLYVGRNAVRVYDSANGQLLARWSAAPLISNVDAGDDGRIYVLSLGRYGTSSSLWAYDRAGNKSPISNPAISGSKIMTVYP